MVLCSLLGAFALFLPSNANAISSADAVSGSAFGASVALLNTTVVPPTPAVTLPATGAAQSANLANIPVNPLVYTGVLTVTTAATHAIQPTQVVNSSADVANAALINGVVAPGNLGASVLSADAIHTVCTSDATGSTGGTTLVSLVIDGTPVPVSDAINQVPTLPSALSPLLSVEINKQVITNSVGATGITVDGVVVTLLSGLDNGAVIILSQSKCGATGPDINVPPTATGVVPNSGPTTNSSNTGTGVVTGAETAAVTPAATAPLAPAVVGVTG
ncbi:MAG TPA: choice-of-anchor P family protein [Acidimicrobiales bacterium]|nr:choice-of-anchor P family protein [Acidimicrobiales bacterium]